MQSHSPKVVLRVRKAIDLVGTVRDFLFTEKTFSLDFIRDNFVVSAELSVYGERDLFFSVSPSVLVL